MKGESTLKPKNAELLFKFTGAIIVAIGFMRISITESFDQGKNIVLIGLGVQLIALAFYVYNKMLKNDS